MAKTGAMVAGPGFSHKRRTIKAQEDGSRNGACAAGCQSPAGTAG